MEVHRDSYRLMCVLAHPDDESMGTGGILAKYAAEGVETCVVIATRGQRGWMGEPNDFPGFETLGKIREAELRESVKVLGVSHLEILNYVDGDLDLAVPQEVIYQIAKLIRHYRPQVVVTFPPDGTYGHPDHIAISQFTLGAILQAASPNGFSNEDSEPYQVKKFYYFVDSKELELTIQSLGLELAMEVDGVVRSEVGWHDWAITTRVDATHFWQRAWRAVLCHRSQLNGGFDMLKDAAEDIHKILWGKQNFYRVFSLVNGGRKVEQDLFEGLSR